MFFKAPTCSTSKIIANCESLVSGDTVLTTVVKISCSFKGIPISCQELLLSAFPHFFVWYIARSNFSLSPFFFFFFFFLGGGGGGAFTCLLRSTYLTIIFRNARYVQQNKGNKFPVTTSMYLYSKRSLAI